MKAKVKQSVVMVLVLSLLVGLVPPQAAFAKEPAGDEVGILEIAVLAGLVYWAYSSLTKPSPVEQYFEANPDLSPVIKEAIKKRQLVVGMNADEVRLAWGEPNRVNKTTTRFGVSEQWVYNKAGYRANYAYLENGVLVSFQD